MDKRRGIRLRQIRNGAQQALKLCLHQPLESSCCKYFPFWKRAILGPKALERPRKSRHISHTNASPRGPAVRVVGPPLLSLDFRKKTAVSFTQEKGHHGILRAFCGAAECERRALSSNLRLFALHSRLISRITTMAPGPNTTICHQRRVLIKRFPHYQTTRPFSARPWNVARTQPEHAPGLEKCSQKCRPRPISQPPRNPDRENRCAQNQVKSRAKKVPADVKAQASSVNTVLCPRWAVAGGLSAPLPILKTDALGSCPARLGDPV